MNKYLIIGIALVVVTFFLILISQKDKGLKNTGSEQTENLTAITPLPETEQIIDEETATDSGTQTPQENVTITPMQEDVTELIIEDLKVGTGTEAIAGKKITVNYKGTLTDGTQFDSSYDRGQPFTFTLGSGQVIQGWDKGFAGLKVGGKRKLTIPPDMGYGSRDMGTIPPNSVLIFEVELLKVE